MGGYLQGCPAEATLLLTPVSVLLRRFHLLAEALSHDNLEHLSQLYICSVGIWLLPITAGCSIYSDSDHFHSF